MTSASPAASGPRLLVINPNTNAAVTARARAAALAVAGPATAISAINPAQGPFAVEGERDRAEAAPHVVALVRDTLDRPYDGYVLACFDDIGIAGARELVRAPVISMAEAAIRAVGARHRRFAVVTTVEAAIPSIAALLDQYGVADRCAVLATGFGVAETSAQSPAAEAALLRTAAMARDRHGAEAIVLGSGAFSGRSVELTATLGLPVFDGLEAAVSHCERVAAAARPRSA